MGVGTITGAAVCATQSSPDPSIQLSRYRLFLCSRLFNPRLTPPVGQRGAAVHYFTPHQVTEEVANNCLIMGKDWSCERVLLSSIEQTGSAYLVQSLLGA